MCMAGLRKIDRNRRCIREQARCSEARGWGRAGNSTVNTTVRESQQRSEEKAKGKEKEKEREREEKERDRAGGRVNVSVNMRRE